MSFVSIKFILFFTVVFVILLILKKFFNKDLRSNIVKIILLISSYIFVIFTDYRFAIFILLYTLITYFIGFKIGKKSKNKKILLSIEIIISVMQLLICKYFNFFAESISNVFGKDYVFIDIIVPLGISFYTFSAISYVVDIYKEKYEYCNNIVDFSLYMVFFPKLISGPIVRPDTFLNQLKEERSVSFKNFEIGIQIFVIGIFKKMVIADHLALFVDDVFNYTNLFSSLTIWLGVFSYSLQIYFDFSGYSDLAIGLSKILGFDFEKNFNIPYISKNVTEFWKRWHISLSSWLQEYIYIPLGGNRKGIIKTYFNLFLTMLIGGIWHGANWTFIVWGMLNGIALIIHKIYMKLRRENKIKDFSHSKIYVFISITLTFLFTTFCWIFFRANSIQDAFNIIHKLFSNNSGVTQIYIYFFFAVAITIIEIVWAIISKKEEKYISIEYPNLNFNKISNLTIFLVFTGITIIMAYVGETQFIYGKF